MCRPSTIWVTCTSRCSSRSQRPDSALTSAAYHSPTVKNDESATGKMSARSGTSSPSFASCTASVTSPRKNMTAAKGSSFPAFSIPSVVIRWFPKSKAMFDRENLWRRTKLRSVCASTRRTRASPTIASSASSAGAEASMMPNFRKSTVPSCTSTQAPPLGPASTVPPLAAGASFFTKR